MSLDQRVVLEPADGSLGPLLRIAEDRLAPGAAYGEHEHMAVDVVAVVLSGSVDHVWGEGVTLGAGDVAVLRSGRGLRHDERAGTGGAHLLQCYLRAAGAVAPPTHEVHRRPRGWVDLGRPDARLWVGSGGGAVPPGVVVTVPGVSTVLVWDLDASRPAWAT